MSEKAREVTSLERDYSAVFLQILAASGHKSPSLKLRRNCWSRGMPIQKGQWQQGPSTGHLSPGEHPWLPLHRKCCASPKSNTILKKGSWVCYLRHLYDPSHIDFRALSYLHPCTVNSMLAEVCLTTLSPTRTIMIPCTLSKELVNKCLLKNEDSVCSLGYQMLIL